MNKLPITSITVGLDIRDMEYGSGQGRFVHLKADAPSGSEGIPIEDAFDQSLDMFVEAWKGSIATRYAGGVGKGEDAVKLMDIFTKKIERIKKYVRESKQD